MNKRIPEYLDLKSLPDLRQIQSIAMYHAPKLYSFWKGRVTRRIENDPNPLTYRRPDVLFLASLWFGFSSNAWCRFLGVWRKHRLRPYPNCSPTVSLLALSFLFTITSKLFNSVYIETQVMRGVQESCLSFFFCVQLTAQKTQQRTKCPYSEQAVRDD